MLERGKMDRNVVEMVEIEHLVPAEHLLRKIDKAMDFSRLYEMVEPLYCEDNGRPSVDPVSVWAAIPPADGRRGGVECSIPLVSWVYIAGGNAPFLHGEL